MASSINMVKAPKDSLDFDKMAGSKEAAASGNYESMAVEYFGDDGKDLYVEKLDNNTYKVYEDNAGDLIEMSVVNAEGVDDSVKNSMNGNVSQTPQATSNASNQLLNVDYSNLSDEDLQKSLEYLYGRYKRGRISGEMYAKQVLSITTEIESRKANGGTSSGSSVASAAAAGAAAASSAASVANASDYSSMSIDQLQKALTDYTDLHDTAQISDAEYERIKGEIQSAMDEKGQPTTTETSTSTNSAATSSDSSVNSDIKSLASSKAVYDRLYEEGKITQAAYEAKMLEINTGLEAKYKELVDANPNNTIAAIAYKVIKNNNNIARQQQDPEFRAELAKETAEQLKGLDEGAPNYEYKIGNQTQTYNNYTTEQLQSNLDAIKNSNSPVTQAAADTIQAELSRRAATQHTDLPGGRFTESYDGGSTIITFENSDNGVMMISSKSGASTSNAEAGSGYSPVAGSTDGLNYVDYDVNGNLDPSSYFPTG